MTMILDNSHAAHLRRALDSVLVVRSQIRLELGSGGLTSAETQHHRDMAMALAGVADALRGLQRMLEQKGVALVG